jgi:hypothetical protein
MNESKSPKTIYYLRKSRRFLRICLMLSFFLLFKSLISLHAQDAFDYELQITPVFIPDLPGLHSYAFAQHDNKWLIIGGRTDGLHARQPFNAFPQAHNNTNIYVIDVYEQNFWTVSINSLPTGLKEQLQSTNMNFFQDSDTLYFIGGYAYAASEDDHITFTNLTSIHVSGLMNAVINGQSILPYFKQISDDVFAVCGGQLGKIGDTYYQVGGHRFDGRYNPFGFPTYTQTYTNQIRKFTVNNSGDQLSFGNYEAITDTIHLHRRDYNLLPQIFADGTPGYTISSGVFQAETDLPFLYPVDITEAGYTPIPDFDQYLSNYHSAKVCFFDSLHNQMHALFFGGMSQFYYQNGELIQDDLVTFVRTISRLTRYADGSLQEHLLPIEMPALQGASAEFIFNPMLPHTNSKIIKLSEVNSDTLLIGHIYGGIQSPLLNPFFSNQTHLTWADTTIFAVRLIKQTQLILGDSNCDGNVNILDLVTTANHILDQNPQPFCPENADANQDQTIDILDLVTTANIIMGSSATNSIQLPDEYNGKVFTFPQTE